MDALPDTIHAAVEEVKPLIKDHKPVMEAWEAKRSGVKEKIRSLAKTGKSTHEPEAIAGLWDTDHRYCMQYQLKPDTANKDNRINGTTQLGSAKWQAISSGAR